MARGRGRGRARDAAAAGGADPAGGAPERADAGACPLCERPIPPGARASRHHLVPKLKGGARLPTVRLHHVCHAAIHARYSEAEIARRLADVASLRADPAMAAFLAWVRTKPADFHAPTRMTREAREHRARRR